MMLLSLCLRHGLAICTKAQLLLNTGALSIALIVIIRTIWLTIIRMLIICIARCLDFRIASQTFRQGSMPIWYLSGLSITCKDITAVFGIRLSVIFQITSRKLSCKFFLWASVFIEDIMLRLEMSAVHLAHWVVLTRSISKDCGMLFHEIVVQSFSTSILLMSTIIS